MIPPRKMNIYNLFPLLGGHFSQWRHHVERAADMGFNWIFVNPIQYPGFSGSLYSIKDFFQINPLLIDPQSKKKPETQAKDLAALTKKLDINMMIDLVINHCAVDSDLLKQHREWFMWDESGSVVHPSCNENGKKIVWGDLAKFNHNHTSDQEGMYQYFFSIVKYLISIGFKGFRCDAAYQVPGRIWKRLICDTKQLYPDVLFFAETLGCTVDETMETARSGFDYIFNSSKWWDLSSRWCVEQYHLTREITASISFPETHDTLRLCDELHGNINGLKQRYLFSALFSSGVMMPIGFEFGFTKRLHVVNTRSEHWEQTDIDLRDFIRSVNKLAGIYTIFQEECPTEMVNIDNPNVLVLWKASIHSRDEAIIIINRDIHNKQRFTIQRLRDLVQAGKPLVDVSPEYQMDFIPEPFSYKLRPGQGIVLVTERNSKK
ncbi:MAG: alpha-amylase family glycosyl hydrolase [Pseudomonadota bacterium]